MKKINVVFLVDVEIQGRKYKRGERVSLPAHLAMEYLKNGWAEEHKMLEPSRRK